MGMKVSDGFINDWFYRARPARNGIPGYIAWCAKVPELGDSPLDIAIGIEVHCAFADTLEEAIAKMWREMAH
jgi:hypothetical protein